MIEHTAVAGHAVPSLFRWEAAVSSLHPPRRSFNELIQGLLGAPEREILVDMGRESRAMAAALQLPAGDAVDIAHAIREFDSVLYGKGYYGHLVVGSDDHAIYRVTRCPLPELAESYGKERGSPYRACSAYNSSLVESLNPGYDLSCTHAICRGDPICEMVIKKNEE